MTDFFARLSILCLLVAINLKLSVCIISNEEKSIEEQVRKLRINDDYEIKFFTSEDIIESFDGTQYNISMNSLEPVDIFDTSENGSYEIVSDDGTEIKDTRTGEIYQISCFQSSPNDCTSIFVCFEEDNSIVNHAVIHDCNGVVTYLEKSHDIAGAYITFTNDAYVDSPINDQFTLDAVDIPDEYGDRSLLRWSSSAIRRENFIRNKNIVEEDSNHQRQLFTYTTADDSSSECRVFKQMKVAITYDAFFCTNYGSHSSAVSRIMQIFAESSIQYKNDMCINLVLDKVIPVHPNEDCSRPNDSFYKNKARDNMCDLTKQSFIRDITDDLSVRRDELGIDVLSTVSHFTGNPLSSTLGCAFKSTACNNRWGYSAGQMGDLDVSTQAMVFIHEFGHNIGMSHYSKSSSDNNKYVMQSIIQTGDVHFSRLSIDASLAYLNKATVTCDQEIQSWQIATRNGPVPAPAPTPKPTLYDLERAIISRSKRSCRGKCRGGTRGGA